MISYTQYFWFNARVNLYFVSINIVFEVGWRSSQWHQTVHSTAGCSAVLFLMFNVQRRKPPSGSSFFQRWRNSWRICLWNANQIFTVSSPQETQFIHEVATIGGVYMSIWFCCWGLDSKALRAHWYISTWSMDTSINFNGYLKNCPTSFSANRNLWKYPLTRYSYTSALVGLSNQYPNKVGTIVFNCFGWSCWSCIFTPRLLEPHHTLRPKTETTIFQWPAWEERRDMLRQRYVTQISVLRLKGEGEVDAENEDKARRRRNGWKNWGKWCIQYNFGGLFKCESLFHYFQV